MPGVIAGLPLFSYDDFRDSGILSMHLSNFEPIFFAALALFMLRGSNSTSSFKTFDKSRLKPRSEKGKFDPWNLNIKKLIKAR